MLSICGVMAPVPVDSEAEEVTCVNRRVPYYFLASLCHLNTNHANTVSLKKPDLDPGNCWATLGGWTCGVRDRGSSARPNSITTSVQASVS